MGTKPISTSAFTIGDRGKATRAVAIWASLVIAALYIVGIESHGIVRHVVQTAPVWPSVVLALRGSKWSKWTAMPCFLFWFSLMVLIWLFLVGVAHVVSGDFTKIEIALTLIVGICCALGFVAAVRLRSNATAIGAFAAFFGILILQLVAFRISLLPAIAHDRWR